MKRIITHISLVAAIAFAASCSQESFLGEEGDGVLTLRLQTAEMSTRATDTVAGEGVENEVTHADFFFFSDEEGTTLLENGHVRLAVGDGGLTAKDGNVYEYKFDASSQYPALKGASYVYVIANYPEEITATTLEDILDLDIKTDLSGELSYFVMDSYGSAVNDYLTYLKPSKANDEKTYTIGLTRAAAKLVLNINVKNSYVDSNDDTWTPVTDQMWVNFVNARKNAQVAAEPVEFDEKANYFQTASQTPTAASSAPEGYTSWKTTAIYTYPQSYETSDVTAPYYKIFCPWISQKKGMNNFYYKIILPDLEGKSFKRNKIYQLTVDVSVIGGTEDDWALVTNHVYVADWWAPEVIEASFEGAMYLDVPVTYYEIYGDDFVDIPVVSSNPIQVTNVTGSKRNLYQVKEDQADSYISVTPTIDIINTKEGVKLTHVLNRDITSSDFDCTPITYTMKVSHTQGGLSKTIDVTVVQYPSIYAQADPSNGYAYVNSYTYGNTSSANQTGTARGGRWRSYQNGNTIGYMAYNNNGDELASMNQGTGLNSNYNQYIVNVSVLPEGYKVSGMTEDVIIGDPRGGQLAHDYLGYAAGTSGGRTTGVQGSYKPAASTTQNIIAPALRIASSWGATIYLNDFERAEERCAAYQENGYPAGRWRLPTVAEIDFLIRLSTYEHIPALFTTNSAELYQSNNNGTQFTLAYTYYSSYWSNGPSVYAGKPYTDNGHTSPYELGGTEVTLTAPGTQSGTYRYYWWVPNNGSYAYTSHSKDLVSANSEYFEPHVRCVYDEWYWSSTKYNSQGQPITGSGTAAEQWIGYIF